MILSRRGALLAAGGAAAALLTARIGSAAEIVVEMSGRPDGSRVWFDPVGIHIAPGTIVRWRNVDPGNAHTATAYHPDNGGHVLRMPASTSAWDSDYLLPGESFAAAFGVEGVYDYFCRPHEHAGMVGRIVVGSPPEPDWSAVGLPEAAVRAFPAVAAILAAGQVRPTL